MLEKLNGEDLYNFILSLDSKDRINILKMPSVKDKFLESNNHYAFVWLIQSLNGSELLSFIDSKYIDEILENDRAIDKINAIMTSGNSYASSVLLSDKVISLIIDPNNLLHYYLNNLDYRIGQGIIDFTINHNTKTLSFIGNLKPKEQQKVFTNEYIVKLLESCVEFRSLIFNLDGKVINK